MRSIENTVTNILVIQKSKFICKLIPLQSEQDVKKELDKVKLEHVGATHYCYAYIIGNNKRSSDDGEPSKTAGMPMLNVLEKNDLNYLLCVVIRYFGGIKLGAGGLVRAYSNAVTKALENSNIIELIKGKLVSFTFSYSDEKQMEYFLNAYQIKERSYQERVTFQAEIPDTDFDLITKSTSNYATIQVETELFIKK